MKKGIIALIVVVLIILGVMWFNTADDSTEATPESSTMTAQEGGSDDLEPLRAGIASAPAEFRACYERELGADVVASIVDGTLEVKADTAQTLKAATETCVEELVPNIEVQ